MKIIKVSAGAARVIEALKGGERISVTYRQPSDPDPVYEITGGGKFRSDCLGAALAALQEAGMVQEISPGLFEGCGQAFLVVR